MNTTIKKLPKNEIEIEGELDTSMFESYFDKAFKKISANIEVDGFRKGKVPEKILLSKIPESKILEEMAEMALQEHYPKIIEEHKLDVITQPEISITKIARGNPLGFKIKTTTMPEIKLPDYKKIAKDTIAGLTEEEKNTEVAEDDVEKTILDIRKARAPKINIANADKEELEKIENKDTTKETEANLPPFNDDFVKSLGDFKDTNDFKEKLLVNLKTEKENAVREKTRLKIAENIIKDTEIDLPEIFIELEINKIIYRMESDIMQMGLKFEDYLKHLNKTIDDLKKDFRGEAEKKAMLALVLNEISKKENLKADQTEIENEVLHILEHYKDADRERAYTYAENILTNEKIFQMLESQA